MATYRRRYTRPPYRRRTGGQGGQTSFVLTALALLALAYIGAATKAGTFLAENVIQPVFRQLGVFSEKAPETSTASTAAPDTAQCTAPAVEGYFLQNGVYASQQNADTAAQTLQSKGGAGYVYIDEDDYRVIISVYRSQADADTVKTRLAETMEVKVLPVSAAAKQIQTDTKEQGTALTESLTLMQQAIDDLYQANQTIETPDKCKESLTGAQQKLHQAKEKLESNFSSAQNEFATALTQLIAQADSDCQAAAQAQDAAFQSKTQLALCRLIGSYIALTSP